MGQLSVVTKQEPDPVNERDLNVALWIALIGALTGFLRIARRHLGMKAGEQCPKCGHRY